MGMKRTPGGAGFLSGLPALRLEQCSMGSLLPRGAVVFFIDGYYGKKTAYLSPE